MVAGGKNTKTLQIARHVKQLVARIQPFSLTQLTPISKKTITVRDPKAARS